MISAAAPARSACPPLEGLCCNARGWLCRGPGHRNQLSRGHLHGDSLAGGAVQLRHRERVGKAGPYGGCGSWEGTRVGNCPKGKGCKLLKWEAGRQGSSPSICVSTDRPAPSSRPCSGPARAGCSALLLGPLSSGSAAPVACHPFACLLPCWQRCDCFPGLLIFITRRSAVPTPERVLGTGSSILPPFCYA